MVELLLAASIVVYARMHLADLLSSGGMLSDERKAESQVIAGGSAETGSCSLCERSQHLQGVV
jgi:hypothetical protein